MSGSPRENGVLADAEALHERLRAAMTKLPDGVADGLMLDVEKLLDGEMSMMAEMAKLRKDLQQCKEALAATEQGASRASGETSDSETHALLEEALTELEHSAAEREKERLQHFALHEDLERELEEVRAELLMRDQELRATCCMVQDILNDVEWSRRQLMMTMLEPEEIALEQLHQCLPGEGEAEREGGREGDHLYGSFRKECESFSGRDRSQGLNVEEPVSVVELLSALDAERKRGELLAQALEHAQTRLDAANRKLAKKGLHGTAGISRMQEVEMLKERLEESQACERKVQEQHERMTKRLQTYLADRGDFNLLQDLNETLDNHGSSRGITDLLEYFVLQFGTIKPNFADPVYRAVFHNLVRWCHEPWAYMSRKGRETETETETGREAGRHGGARGHSPARSARSASAKVSARGRERAGSVDGGDEGVRDASRSGVPLCRSSIARNIAAVCGILARGDKTREEMLSHGVVEAMVALMKSLDTIGKQEQQHATYVGTMEQACACLSNVMLHSEAGREVLVSSGGLEVLISQLHAFVHTDIQEKACSALANFACSKVNKELIGSQKGVLPLVEICRTQRSARATENAARALRNLAHNSMSNCSVIAACGGLDVMASLCEHSTDESICAQASAALANLAVHDRNRSELKDKWGWSANVLFQLETSASKHRIKRVDIIATRCLPAAPEPPKRAKGERAKSAASAMQACSKGVREQNRSTLSRNSKSPIARTPNSTILSANTSPPHYFGDRDDGGVLNTSSSTVPSLRQCWASASGPPDPGGARGRPKSHDGRGHAQEQRPIEVERGREKPATSTYNMTYAQLAAYRSSRAQ